MKYWDSSALVPLVVRQAATERVRSLYREDPHVFTWWGTRIECVAAVSRLEREKALSASAVRTSLRRLNDLASRWHEVEPADALRSLAQRLLRTHPLRTADALQLAAALRSVPEGEFVCLDARLNAAAEKEALTVIFPEEV